MIRVLFFLRNIVLFVLLFQTLNMNSTALSQYQRYSIPRPQYHPTPQTIQPGYGRYQSQQYYRFNPYTDRRYQPNPYRYRVPNNGYSNPLPKAPTASSNPTGYSNRRSRPSSLNHSGSSSSTSAPSSHGHPKPDSVPSYSLYPRMIAEFEPQRAILLSVCDLQPHHQHVLKQIVEKSAGHADILILYNDNQQLKNTVELLRNVPNDHVSFYQLQLDTVWLRDFGPRIVEVADGTRTLDFYYYGVRPYDDAFPERWSLETDSRLDKVAWTLQGGNLICNGQGLGIATTRIFDDNAVSIGSQHAGPSVNAQGKQFVLQELKRAINLQELVVLEPLLYESTKHVDMFAAFIAPDHVLVAQLGPGTHRSNAQILDYNARKLSRITIGGKPLKVDRIQIPPPDGKSWSTYTNAIFTDKLILLPVMKSDPPQIVRNAIETYRRLMPDHHIETVDITSMKKLQGSLHCLSINLPAAAPLPAGVIDLSVAMKVADRTVAVKKSDPSQPVLLNSKYTIDEQLRNIFKSSSQDYLVDAYAVALQGDVVTLLLSNNLKTIRVKTTGVCKADQLWINRNADKIRKQGSQVYRMITARGTR